ncbi:hypothetical protein [Rugamonas aquatica]|uniref:Uncharacterized protein n=1 Tax=Rugamonas aquatica TaxID=2743357 RepID=A0A6A7N5E4_9BURK|nr:hypothetical protein [Rugamonas aquatica]MQA40293.1 hypothetical protein [Rugamonas aquatica]
MVDRIALLVVGTICAWLAWASLHFGGEPMTGLVMAVVLVGYAVDNFQLRRQVRQLLADSDRRERRERDIGLRRLMRDLCALRDQRKEG